MGFILEFAFNLLLQPKKMAMSFRRRPPLREALSLSFVLFFLFMAYLVGSGGFKEFKFYFSLSISMFIFAMSFFTLFVYCFHLNLRIFGSKLGYLSAFLPMLAIACSLVLYFRFPFFVIFSILGVNYVISTLNMYINILFGLFFLGYSIVVMARVYEVEVWKIVMSYILIVGYVVFFVVFYGVSLHLIRNLY